MITREEALQAYDELVQFRRLNPLNPKDYPPGGTETHHVVPVSCGGEDVPENLVRLEAKEHFMAHVYLWAIHRDDEFHVQMMNALLMMQVGTVRGTRSSIREFVLASEEYQKARKEFAAYMAQTISPKISGEKNGQFGKHWYYDPKTLDAKLLCENDVPDGWIPGKIYGDSFRDTISKISTGRVWICSVDGTEQKRANPQEAEKLLSTGKWKKGRIKYSDEVKARMRARTLATQLKHGRMFKQQKCAECGTVLTFGQKTFCCDACAQKFYEKQQQTKLEKRREKILDSIIQNQCFPVHSNGVHVGVVDRCYVRVYLESTVEQCCAKCGKADCKLTVHAKDGNCRNPALDNFEFLCRECYLKSGTAGFSGRSMRDINKRKREDSTAN